MTTPACLTLFMVYPKGIAARGITIVARTPDQAWAKYVAQNFRNSPLKPNRQDFYILAI
jgi:hypothetical protein